MTENEAIEKLHAYLECESRRAKIVSYNENCDDCELWYMQGTGGEHIASVETAIKALEEVQQYRQIGTVEECREAVKKQTVRKPVRLGKCTCPSCSTHNETWRKRRNTIPSDIVYCWHCGQAVEIKRSDEAEQVGTVTVVGLNDAIEIVKAGGADAEH